MTGTASTKYKGGKSRAANRAVKAKKGSQASQPGGVGAGGEETRVQRSDVVSRPVSGSQNKKPARPLPARREAAVGAHRQPMPRREN